MTGLVLNSAANKCLVKVATMCSNLQQFEKASDIFEQACAAYHLLFFDGDMYIFLTQIGRNSLENTLLKYGAKDYFFKAAICRFCIGPTLARVSLSYEGEEEGEGGRGHLYSVDSLPCP